MNLQEKLQKKILDIQQKQVTKQYKKQGLTDTILEKQVKINSKRHKLNISESEGEYLQ